MNVDKGTSPSASSTTGQNFAQPAANQGYFYNRDYQIMLQQQQRHEQADQSQQQQRSLLLQQYSQYPLYSTSPASLLNYRPGLLNSITSPALARALSTFNADKSRRSRGEKKPIPDDQKDDRYFERRRRNNEAAKKSRDTRKTREDHLALRAAVYEQDNAVCVATVKMLIEKNARLKETYITKCQEKAMKCQMRLTQQNGQNTMQNQAQSSSQDPVANSVGQQGKS